MTFTIPDNLGSVIGSNDDDFMALALRIPSDVASSSAYINFILKEGNFATLTYPDTNPTQDKWRTLGGEIQTPNPDGSDNGLALVLGIDNKAAPLRSGIIWKRLAFGGNQFGTPISSDVTLDPSTVNTIYQVDISSADVTVTLPLHTNVPLGVAYTFQIFDSSQPFRMRIQGQGGDLIGLFASHDFYEISSSVTVINYPNEWYITDFNDDISVFSNALFSGGATQSFAPDVAQTVLFPQVGVNYGSSYNPATGIFTVPVAGDWLFTFMLQFSPYPSGNQQTGICQLHINGNVRTVNHVTFGSTLGSTAGRVNTPNGSYSAHNLSVGDQVNVVGRQFNSNSLSRNVESPSNFQASLLKRKM
jgi:hypothetical protein